MRLTTAWVLECGCEPEIEHCRQCDERRVLRRKAEDARRLAGYADELRTAGYSVAAPIDARKVGMSDGWRKVELDNDD